MLTPPKRESPGKNCMRIGLEAGTAPGTTDCLYPDDCRVGYWCDNALPGNGQCVESGGAADLRKRIARAEKLYRKPYDTWDASRWAEFGQELLGRDGRYDLVLFLVKTINDVAQAQGSDLSSALDALAKASDQFLAREGLDRSFFDGRDRPNSEASED